MIYSRKYSRNFIPLKQDSQNYSLDFRPAIGKCLIEIKDGKGKINVYAQGVKPDNEYRVELMCFEKGNLKNVSIGTLSVDSSGKGEIKVDFDPENVLETGNKIEEFSVIALLVEGLEKAVSSLVGYMGNEISWRDKYIMPMPKRDCCCPGKQELIKPMPPQNSVQKPIKPQQPNRPIEPIEQKPNIPMPPQNSVQKPEENYSELEKGLIEKVEGLIKREKGLIKREEGLIYKEKNLNMPVDLADLEKLLFEKEQGLLKKQEGLSDKEKGLLAKENALNNGFLPSDSDYALREKEKQIINIEKNLINYENSLILREEQLIRRKSPAKTDLEKGLRERELGLLEKEKGLLEKEKGLILKEEGLFEKEEGLREKKYYENIESKKDNKTKFKEMLNELKNDIYNFKYKEEKIEEEDKINEIELNNFENEYIEEYKMNKDIEYIKQNNMKLTPFKDTDENISWFRICPSELSIFEGDIWKYANNPFVYNCYKKFNHLMLGIKNQGDKESYILGIPCRFEDNFSIFGFENFSPLDENVSLSNIQNGEYGYRLLEI